MVHDSKAKVSTPRSYSQASQALTSVKIPQLLSKSDLNRLCLVSKHVKKITVPHLYRSISLRIKEEDYMYERGGCLDLSQLSMVIR